MLRRTAWLLLAGTVALAPCLVPSTSAAGPPTTARDASQRAHPSSVVVDWERSSIRTIFTQAALPIPVGVLYLGFVSLAMHDAVETSLETRGSSEAAAAAAAAHGVLTEYFEAWTTDLDADLAASLASLGSGPGVATGVGVGEDAATRMIDSRDDDGRDDPTILYSKPMEPGFWQPPAGGSMLAPWLGSVEPLVLDQLVTLNGPDRLTSRQYTRDYNEVRRLGSATSTERTPGQTETALFFNSNSAIMVAEAVLNRLEVQPVSLRRTARLFAVMHGAMADSIITCWQLKRDVGFWRPFQAIAGAADDGNPRTQPESGWTPLIPNPPYSDYVSGHASLTGPAVEAVRRFLGEGTDLTLHSSATNTDRTYSRLRAIERDAFGARIWGGLHFRDAMEDGYQLGHRTARRVMRALR